MCVCVITRQLTHFDLDFVVCHQYETFCVRIKVVLACVSMAPYGQVGTIGTT